MKILHEVRRAMLNGFCFRKSAKVYLDCPPFLHCFSKRMGWTENGESYVAFVKADVKTGAFFLFGGHCVDVVICRCGLSCSARF
jgi:hypothetical protein